MKSLTAAEETAPDAGGRTAQRVHKFAYADDQFSMNRLQKSFYNRVYLPSVRVGKPLDVQGQRGYSEVLVHQLIGEHRSDPAGARRTLQMLLEKCSRDDLPYDVKDVMADFLFLAGDFKAGFEALGLGASASLYLTLAEYLGHPPLAASQVLQWGDWGVTRKGIAILGDVVDALQARLDAFHAKAGISMVEDFWRRLNADKPVQEVVADIADGIVPAGIYTEEDICFLLERSRESPIHGLPIRALQGKREYEQTIDWPASWVSTTSQYHLFRVWLRRLAREAENSARDAQQIPRVGEGLVSEIALLRQIEALLPGERVVHQARPYWLAPQSLDIYLPDYSIGIEHQGAQHSAPVEFFGGSDTFDAQVKRDARKRQACEEVGCALIEVYPGYRIEDVIGQVKDAMRPGLA